MLDISFPYEKVVQALAYLTQKNNGKINKMKIIKLIYFADRFHLRKYGKLLSGDKYYGMEYGAVPSITKDLATRNIFLDENVLEYIDNYLDTSEQYDLGLKNDCELDFLSESELEALDFAFQVFGDKDEFQLANISHDYPEWDNIKEELQSKKRAEMNVMDFLGDPINEQNPCFELSEGDKADLKEELEEKEGLEKLLD